MHAASHPLNSRLGRFELRRLLGKSARTMAWLAYDPKAQAEVMVCMPRAPLSEPALAVWQQAALGASRLSHPRVLRPLEIGSAERWPYVVYPRQDLQTAAERLSGESPTPTDSARWGCEWLEGLAYAHEAGVTHQDIGLHHMLLDGHGHAVLMGLAVAWPLARPAADGAGNQASAMDTDLLRNRREASERDVLTLGLALHQLLNGAPALDDPDLGSAAERVGLEIVRLPWTTPHPVPEALRAIVNRATDRQPRQRYLNARTLLRALQGWIEASSQSSGGPMTLVLDRVQTLGHLPGRPGLAARVAQLARMEGQRLDEMVDLIVQDPALVCELLRVINAAQFHGHGTGPVASVRRAVLLMGMRGVEDASRGLRSWPGTLSDGPNSPAARALEQGLRRTCMVGRIADILCPPGTDSQEAMIVAMLQGLGRLLLLYHLPEESAQIVRLMQPAPPPEPGQPEVPGMTEAAATAAVLGIETEHLGQTVARQWGLDDSLIQAMRPLSLQTPVRKPDDQSDILRAVASAAHELLDASSKPPQKQAAALHAVAQRYGRALDITIKDLQGALLEARQAVPGGDDAPGMGASARAAAS